MKQKAVYVAYLLYALLIVTSNAMAVQTADYLVGKINTGDTRSKQFYIDWVDSSVRIIEQNLNGHTHDDRYYRKDETWSRTEADARYLQTAGAYVSRFNNRSGDVFPQAGDYTTSIVAEGSNKYYTDARVQAYADTRYSLLGHSHDDLYYRKADVYTKSEGDFRYLSAQTVYVSRFNNRSGDVFPQAGDYTTSIVAEGTNLYYTQGRFDIAFAAKSTTNLAEGTNLYYTQARFDTAFAAKSTTNLAEGTNLYYTDARVQSFGDTRYSQLGHTHAGMLTGSGTTGYLPYFTGTSTLANSLLFQTGIRVGINTTTFTAPLTANRSVLELGGAESLLTLTASGGASHFFADANSTQIESSGARSLIFLVNGGFRVQIAPSGNFLLGTTTDFGKLFYANGTGQFTGSLTASISALGSAATTYVTHTGGLLQSRTSAQVLADIGGLSGNGTAGYLPYYTGSSTLAISAMYYNGANIGLGTTNPQAKLHLAGLTELLRLQEDGAFISFFTTAGVRNAFIQGNNAGSQLQIAAENAFALHLSTSLGIIRLTAAGDVGIGTSAPLFKQHSLAATNIFYLEHGTSTTDYSGLYFGSNGNFQGGAILSYRANHNFSGNEADLRFYTFNGSNTAGFSGIERLRIGTGSKSEILIGTTTVALGASGRGLVEINGDSGSISILGLKVNNAVRGYFYANATNSYLFSAGGLYFGSGGSEERAYLSTVGNLILGGSIERTGYKLRVLSGAIEGDGGADFHSGIFDPYGWITINRPADASYTYLGLVRTGNIAWGVGINTSNQFTIGSTTSGKNGVANEDRFIISNVGTSTVLLGTSLTNYGTSGRGTLEINGSSNAIMALKVGNTPRAYFYATATEAELLSVGNLSLLAGNTLVAKLTSAGNLLVGPATEESIRVNISGVIKASNGAILGNPTLTGQPDALVYLGNNNGSPLIAVALYKPSSAVRDLVFYLGTTERSSLTSSTAGLSISSNFLPDTTNSYNLGSGTRLWSTVYATNGTINTSDIRYKTNIKPLKAGLEEAIAIAQKTITFNWKKNPSPKLHNGVSAQDLLKILPNVVDDSNPNRLGINMAELIPVLFNAIKELSDKVNKLEAQQA